MTMPDIDSPATIPHATVKSYLLLLLLIGLLGGFILYVMAARGVFEDKQGLVLLAENSEGVVVGMDMTFSGFAIGRVVRIQLGEDGKAHIDVEVPTKDARWLRTSSVFTLERGVVGGARLRAYTGLLDDPPLPDGARREVLIGDAAAGIPQLVSTLRELLDNLNQISGAMKGEQGVLPGLLGPAGARQILDSIARTNRLLAQADARLAGKGGMLAESQAAVAELRGMLTDARSSLKKVDATLEQAYALAVNARVASDDLVVLRNEVEASLRRVSQLVDEVNRKWPFARDRELKLP